MVVRCRFGQTGKRLKPVKESHRDKLQAAHKPFMQNTFDCDPSDSDLMASAKRIVSPRAARTRGLLQTWSEVAQPRPQRRPVHKDSLLLREHSSEELSILREVHMGPAFHFDDRPLSIAESHPFAAFLGVSVGRGCFAF